MPAKARMRATSRLHRAFCEKVKSRREQLGLTQQQVADALGVTQPAYGVIETGKHSPNLALIERLAKALKTRPADLLSATEELAVA